MISVSARAAATRTAASFRYTKPSNWLILGIPELSRVYSLSFLCAGARVKNQSAAKITVNVIEQERNVPRNANVWIVKMAKFISTIHISNQGWKLKLTLDFPICIFILLFLISFMIYILEAICSIILFCIISFLSKINTKYAKILLNLST